MRRLAHTLALLLLAATATAQESLDDLDKGKVEAPAAASKTKASAATEVGTQQVAEVNGYADNRFQFTWVNPHVAPLPTRDLPTLQDILEGNVQLKVHLGKKAFFYADVSIFFQAGGLYYSMDEMRNRIQVPEHDVPSLRPSVVTSELYLNYSPAPWMNLLLGKKRIVWGSGFAFNPTDLINPPKDPTNPNFQRAGAWMAKVELPFEKFTISTVFVPSVLYQQSGLPFALMKYPDYPPAETVANPTLVRDPRVDEQFHYLLAARLYMLLYDTDVNFIYYFSNKYNDGFENKSRFGASFSRYFFTDYELHIEALLQQGSSRSYADHWCANDLLQCNITEPLKNFAPTKLRSDAFYPRLLIGGRTQFRDESILSIEYYYQADGYSDQELEDYVRLLALVRRLNVPFGGGATTNGTAPQNFNFDPLRRHYLIASYSKPKIFDDWTVSLVWIASLADLSSLITPSVSWNAKEWLTLTLSAFIPIRGIPVNQVTDLTGQKYSDYSIFPLDVRVLFQTRVFY
jgi:hypothetical protein